MAKSTQTQTNIRIELARLQTMETKELRNKWRELYDKEPPDCGKVFLQRQLAFRIQEKQYGGISQSARETLEAVGNKPKPVKNSGGFLLGTRFERSWKGEICVVTATADGFEFKGQNFQSLSGVAYAITGTQWNGKKFFGVK